MHRENSAIEGLTTASFLKEIHHLLWMKPFVNRGILDVGWSCRDHSFIVGMLLELLGYETYIQFGRCILVSGPVPRFPASGLAADPHRWNFVPQIGHIDLSVRARHKEFAWWNKWIVDCVYASEVRPAGTKIVFTNSDKQFQYGLNAARAIPEEFAIVYQTLRTERIRDISAANAHSWIFSPLADELEQDFKSGPLIYFQAIYHLWMFLHGERTSLAGMPSFKAWREISCIPAQEAVELTSRGQAARSGS